MAVADDKKYFVQCRQQKYVVEGFTRQEALQKAQADWSADQLPIDNAALEKYLSAKPKEQLWWALSRKDDIIKIFSELSALNWPDIISWQTFGAKRNAKLMSEFFGYEKIPDQRGKGERFKEFRDKNKAKEFGFAQAGKYKSCYKKIGLAIDEATLARFMIGGSK